MDSPIVGDAAPNPDQSAPSAQSSASRGKGRIGVGGLIFLFACAFAMGWAYPPVWFRVGVLLLPLYGGAFAGIKSKSLPRALNGLMQGAMLCGPIAGTEAAGYAHFVDLGAPMAVSVAGAIAFWCFGGAGSEPGAPQSATSWVRRSYERRNPKKLMERKAQIFVALLFTVWFAGYSFALFTMINEQLDAAKPQIFQANVVSKRVRAGLSGHGHEITLSPWGPTIYTGRVDIAPEVYGRLQKGGRACVNLRPGFLGARWFGVSAC